MEKLKLFRTEIKSLRLLLEKTCSVFRTESVGIILWIFSQRQAL